MVGKSLGLLDCGWGLDGWKEGEYVIQSWAPPMPMQLWCIGLGMQAKESYNRR